jgi:hypothetical protein
VNLADRNGQTPLMGAFSTGRIDIAKLLIESGADVTVKDKSKNGIMAYAKQSGDPKVIEFAANATPSTTKTAKVQPTTRYFRPKKDSEAEYTFVPTKTLEKFHDCEPDVGFFLNHGEILALDPTKKAPAKGGVLTLSIDEGKVSLHQDQWDEMTSVEVAKATKGKTPAVLHTIDDITQEYLSD